MFPTYILAPKDHMRVAWNWKLHSSRLSNSTNWIKEHLSTKLPQIGLQFCSTFFCLKDQLDFKINASMKSPTKFRDFSTNPFALSFLIFKPALACYHDEKSSLFLQGAKILLSSLSSLSSYKKTIFSSFYKRTLLYVWLGTKVHQISKPLFPDSLGTLESRSSTEVTWTLVLLLHYAMVRKKSLEMKLG